MKKLQGEGLAAGSGQGEINDVVFWHKAFAQRAAILVKKCGKGKRRIAQQPSCRGLG